jgi:hypothetical protein
VAVAPAQTGTAPHNDFEHVPAPHTCVHSTALNMPSNEHQALELSCSSSIEQHKRCLSEIDATERLWRPQSAHCAHNSKHSKVQCRLYTGRSTTSSYGRSQVVTAAVRAIWSHSRHGIPRKRGDKLFSQPGVHNPSSFRTQAGVLAQCCPP